MQETLSSNTHDTILDLLALQGIMSTSNAFTHPDTTRRHREAGVCAHTLGAVGSGECQATPTRVAIGSDHQPERMRTQVTHGATWGCLELSVGATN